MVLKEVAAGWRKPKNQEEEPTHIHQVRTSWIHRIKVRSGISTASNWILVADLQLVFPPEIAVKRLLSDTVMWSRNTRNLIIIELTVPWEERMEEANERKREKYQDLVDECKEKGWKTWCWPIEVGSRGFAGQSMWRMLKNLGIVGN